MRMILLAAVIGAAVAAETGLARSAEAGATQQDSKSSALHTPRPPSNWWKTEKYMQELRLTPEQSSQINEIVETSLARLKADKEDLDRAQGDFRQLMERANVPQRELLKAAERLEMCRYSISKERTTMLVRIHSVLTPDQRRGLDAIAMRHEAERNRKK